jgi:hypothetical protein
MILPSDGFIAIVPRDRLHNSIAPSFVEATKHIPDAVQAISALRGEVAQHTQPCAPTAVTVEKRDGLLVLADDLDGAANLAVLGEKAPHALEIRKLAWSKEGAVVGIGEGRPKAA